MLGSVQVELNCSVGGKSQGIPNTLHPLCMKDNETLNPVLVHSFLI